jgi:hypothetical protein
MAAVQTVITLTHDKDTAADIAAVVTTGVPVSDTFTGINKVVDLLTQIASGGRNATMDVQVGGSTAVQASATITLTGVGAANDTILINGVTFTAKASGAVADQWNIGGSATLSAAAIAAAINASVTSLVSGYVTASSSGAVVTVTAVPYGLFGNAMTLAKGVDAGSVMTVSSARLAGGTVTANTFHYGI